MAFDPINMGITDEVIAVRATADYFTFAPKDQVLCEGDDGTFASGERWTLRSSTVDFSTAGLAEGSMIEIGFPEKGFGNGMPNKNRTVFTQFALDSVDDTVPSGLILRRKGLAATGIGQPPAPIAGATKCPFRSLTCQPQVRVAVHDIILKYEIGRGITVENDDDFVNLAFWWVVRDLYYAQARMANDPKDNFWQKYKDAAMAVKSIEENLDGRYDVVPDNATGLTLGILPGRSSRRRDCDEMGGYGWRYC